MAHRYEKLNDHAVFCPHCGDIKEEQQHQCCCHHYYRPYTYPFWTWSSGLTTGTVPSIPPTTITYSTNT